MIPLVSDDTKLTSRSYSMVFCLDKKRFQSFWDYFFPFEEKFCRRAYLPTKRQKIPAGESINMSIMEKMEDLLKAMGDKSRLQILECIQQGINNPGKVSRNLNRHRSTIEKHLRVLVKAGIVEKTPSLTSQGHLSVSYKITDKAAKLLAAVKEACREF
jgi:DNA-binding transcriptional ArsR family regulator